MLKASGMDKTANQTLSGSDVTALGDQSQDETQVETGAAGTEGGAERLAPGVEDNNMETGSHILICCIMQTAPDSNMINYTTQTSASVENE